MVKDKPALSKKTGVRRVLIVDDHPVVREGLAMRIAACSDLQVCGEADDIASALKMLADTKPDLAVIDIVLKNSTGLELIKHMQAKHSTVRVLVWSMYNEGLYAERALRAGAHGYITKERATEKIIEAI